MTYKNGEVFSVHVVKAYVGMEVELNSFLTSALDIYPPLFYPRKTNPDILWVGERVIIRSGLDAL
jgi:hypothetical protein